MSLFAKSPLRALLDSVEPAEERNAAPAAALFDAAEYEGINARMSVAAIIQEWAHTPDDELDDGETMADRLIGLLAASVLDDDAEGDLSEDEASLLQAHFEAAGQYLARCGASDADITAALDDGDAGAADRIADLVAEGDGGDTDEFAFSPGENEAAFDSILDAAYRKRTVIRGGVKMRINKRVSGRVRVTGAMRVALRKARSKSHSSAARMNRMRSMKIRKRMGLHSGS